MIQQPKTRTPVRLDDVLGALQHLQQPASPLPKSSAIETLLSAGSTALSGKGTDVNLAITSLGGAVNTVAGQRGDVTGEVAGQPDRHDRRQQQRPPVRQPGQPGQRAAHRLTSRRPGR